MAEVKETNYTPDDIDIVNSNIKRLRNCTFEFIRDPTKFKPSKFQREIEQIKAETVNQPITRILAITQAMHTFDFGPENTTYNGWGKYTKDADLFTKLAEGIDLSFVDNFTEIDDTDPEMIKAWNKLKKKVFKNTVFEKWSGPPPLRFKRGHVCYFKGSDKSLAPSIFKKHNIHVMYLVYAGKYALEQKTKNVFTYAGSSTDPIWNLLTKFQQYTFLLTIEWELKKFIQFCVSMSKALKIGITAPGTPNILFNKRICNKHTEDGIDRCAYGSFGATVEERADVNKKIAKTQRKNWADPNSIYNSAEHREHLRVGQNAKIAANPNYAHALSETMKSKIYPGSDMVKHLKKATAAAVAANTGRKVSDSRRAACRLNSINAHADGKYKNSAQWSKTGLWKKDKTTIDYARIYQDGQANDLTKQQIHYYLVEKQAVYYTSSSIKKNNKGTWVTRFNEYFQQKNQHTDSKNFVKWDEKETDNILSAISDDLKTQKGIELLNKFQQIKYNKNKVLHLVFQIVLLMDDLNEKLNNNKNMKYWHELNDCKRLRWVINKYVWSAFDVTGKNCFIVGIRRTRKEMEKRLPSLKFSLNTNVYMAGVITGLLAFYIKKAGCYAIQRNKKRIEPPDLQLVDGNLVQLQRMQMEMEKLFYQQNKFQSFVQDKYKELLYAMYEFQQNNAVLQIKDVLSGSIAEAGGAFVLGLRKIKEIQLQKDILNKKINHIKSQLLIEILVQSNSEIRNQMSIELLNDIYVEFGFTETGTSDDENNMNEDNENNMSEDDEKNMNEDNENNMSEDDENDDDDDEFTIYRRTRSKYKIK
eukprot:95572_1